MEQLLYIVIIASLMGLAICNEKGLEPPKQPLLSEGTADYDMVVQAMEWDTLLPNCRSEGPNIYQ
uniref:Uncharacterized protein n=1 Tax=Timema tahoe TaxID=61484 RepID=A0A7R9FL17_9NEOP|nr:unnamed protein product [Timema tahoe]